MSIYTLHSYNHLVMGVKINQTNLIQNFKDVSLKLGNLLMCTSLVGINKQLLDWDSTFFK